MENIREIIAESNEDILFLDEEMYDEAIIGVCHRFGQQPIVSYDIDKIIDILMRNGLLYQDAIDHFEFNMIGAGMGENTPCFIKKIMEN